MIENAVLQVEGLKTYFLEKNKVTKAVDDVSFTVARSLTLGLAGESGCGKSITSLSIMRLVPGPAGKIVGGRVFLDGIDILTIPEEEMRKKRGRELSMVFQEPMTSLNPVFTVGHQIVEVFNTHFDLGNRQAKQKAIDLMSRVGLPDPSRRFNEYPHQMSGGMRQRVLIAMALAGNPKVLIADEPTTALDVTIQAQILELIDSLREEMGMGTLLITHDLGVIAEMAHTVAIMYAGRIVESAPVHAIFQSQYHPYTEGLMNSLPSKSTNEHADRLSVIPGSVPDLAALPPGCPFEPRCYRKTPVCRREAPLSEEKESGRWARCWVEP